MSWNEKKDKINEKRTNKPEKSLNRGVRKLYKDDEYVWLWACLYGMVLIGLKKG